MIKKITKLAAYVFILFLLIDPSSAMAQGKVEISPYGGWMFGGKMRFYEGELNIKSNGSYGLDVDIEVAYDTKIRLSWNQMTTTATFNPYWSYEYLRKGPFDVSVGYIQIGTVKEVVMDNIRPYGIFTLGTTYFIPDNSVYQDSWKFSITLGGGAKIWVSDRIGIRLQGRLMMPMFWGGVGFTAGSGGSGFTIGAGSALLQGDITGGLVIALGD